MTRKRFPFRALGLGLAGSAAIGLIAYLLSGSVLLAVVSGWILSPAILLGAGYVLLPPESRGRKQETGRQD